MNVNKSYELWAQLKRVPAAATAAATTVIVTQPARIYENNDFDLSSLLKTRTEN